MTSRRLRVIPIQCSQYQASLANSSFICTKSSSLFQAIAKVYTSRAVAHFGLGKILFCILYWVYWFFIQPVKLKALGAGKKRDAENEVARSVPELRAKKDYLSLGVIAKVF